MGKQNLDNDERNKRSTEVWDKLINHMLEQAPKSADHTENVLEKFCFAVEGGATPDWRILEYLAKLFRSRIDQGDTQLFSMLTRTPQKPGRTPLKKQYKINERNLELARKVERLRRFGMTATNAIKEVANTEGHSQKMVKEAHDMYGKIVREYKID